MSAGTTISKHTNDPGSTAILPQGRPKADVCRRTRIQKKIVFTGIDGYYDNFQRANSKILDFFRDKNKKFREDSIAPIMYGFYSGLRTTTFRGKFTNGNEYNFFFIVNC